MVLAGHPTREAPAHAAHTIFQQVDLPRCFAYSSTHIHTSTCIFAVAAFAVIISMLLLPQFPLGSQLVSSESRPNSLLGWRACSDTVVKSTAQHSMAQHSIAWHSIADTAWHDWHIMLWLWCRVTPCRRRPETNWGQEGQAPTQLPLPAW